MEAEGKRLGSRRSAWMRRGAVVAVLLLSGLGLGRCALSRADGPVGIFAGGPLRSGRMVPLAEIDWTALDARPDLELEIVGAQSSRTLWFSVDAGVAYVACDLDCMDGRLTRWPQQIERDDRVVVRIDGRRAEGRLIHVPHASEEYVRVKAGRDRKYSAERGGGAAAERAAHDAVVEVGEALTGRSQRSEPGDRLYRLDPR